jgi:hypothetical protein
MGWVLKSDFGCEGAEVVVGAEVDDGLWAVAVHQAFTGSQGVIQPAAGS